MRLNKKVILVTASTRGIGLAAVAACAKEGAIVYMAARNRERAETRIKELKNETGNQHIHYVHYDAGQLETCRSMADEVAKAGSTSSLITSVLPIRPWIWISQKPPLKPS